MGYSTSFSGTLNFTKELTASELAHLASLLEDDSYIDLQFNKEYAGLEWDGSEKTYEMVEKTNLIIDNMQGKYPDFGLTGQLLAQGDGIGDVWILKIVDGRAVEVPFPKPDDVITCPNCDHNFQI